jgi:putative hydrolase of the HAD superfamily
VRPPLRAIAFDCYGTLVDFGDHGFQRAYDEVCRLQGLPCDGVTLWDKWMEIWRRRVRQPGGGESPPNGPMLVVETRPLKGPLPAFHPYREEWPAHFAQAFSELGLKGDPEAAYQHVRRRLAEAVAFPEARAVVEGLRPRYRLALLSNADDDFLLPCLERNGLAFEVVVSSESARAYKPHEGIFHRLTAELGLEPGEVMYVGDSHFADVLGAKHAGLRVAWLNREGRALPEGIPQPDLELRSLRELPSLVLPGGQET